MERSVFTNGKGGGMIRFLENDQINLKKWDVAVDASMQGMVYAKSWYLDIVSPGWQALADEHYENIFPLTWRKKFGLNYLHQPFFTQQLGIFSNTVLTEKAVENILSAIPQRFRLIEIQLNHGNRISNGIWKVSERLTHHLDLNKPYDALYNNYSENLKRNLKKAHQNNLLVTDEFETRKLIELFQSNKGKEVETLKDKDYAVLEKLVEEGSKRNLITRSGIVMKGKLEAGAIFLQSNREYIFLFSATGEEAKSSGAMTFIIDRFIHDHASSAMKLDFEGSMDSGLARFYKSFGSQEIVYLQIRKNNLPLPIRWIK